MTQEMAITEYIKEHGSITPMEAWEHLGITKLATVVSLMRRKKGVKFIIERVDTVNRYGHDVRFARYSFPKEEEVKNE